MTDLLDFDRPAVRNDDPDTAHEAFHSLDVKGRQRFLLDAIEKHFPGGFICSELAWKVGLERDSVSPRLPEMEERGRIQRTERRRKWRSNRKQIVWELTT